MCALTTVLLAAVPAAMITVYWICFIVGGGLLIISTLSGMDSHAGVNVDVHTDVDMDVDVNTDIHHEFDGHAHGSALASWFSIQFLVFFATVFGAVGVVLSHLTQTGSTATLGAAAAVGLLFGQGAHQTLAKLRRSSGNSTPRPEDYVNKLAKVTMAFAYPDKGEVVLRVGQSDRYVPAVSKRADAAFARFDEVAVVTYEGGIAEVISRQEFEFLTSKD